MIERENPVGVIVQFGGQTALNLARELAREGIDILGTPLEAIDRAEDREKFERLLAEAGIPQPPGAAVTSVEEALEKGGSPGIPGAGPPLLRAGRTGDGDRPQPRRTPLLHGGGGQGESGTSGADRPLSQGKGAGGGRPLRRGDRADSRHHGTHRAGRGPFRRFHRRLSHPIAHSRPKGAADGHHRPDRPIPPHSGASSISSSSSTAERSTSWR